MRATYLFCAGVLTFYLTIGAAAWANRCRIIPFWGFVGVLAWTLMEFTIGTVCVPARRRRGALRPDMLHRRRIVQRTMRKLLWVSQCH
ncbi:hypothetical protein P3T18_003058 [Paraburkholderia sp. GAS199]